MNTLRAVATAYDNHANRLARRHEGKLKRVVGHTRKEGKRVAITIADVIDNYRTNADRVRALIPPDEAPAETQWSLEASETPALGPGSTVTAKDKVANPKELLEKFTK